MIKKLGPDPNAVFPNPSIKSVCYIKNVVTRPNIEVGSTPIMTTSTVRSALRSGSRIIIPLLRINW